MSSSSSEIADDFPCLVLHSKLNEFRANGKHCDVAVKVEERIFKAHRVVLASACGYFDALFSVGFRDTFEDTVVLSDIDATAFECLLDYAYLGSLPKISSSNVLTLLFASEYLDVEKIKNCCVDYISFPGNVALIEDIFEFFEYSSRINNLKLVDCALEHIVKNFNILSQDENFLLLSFDQLNMVLKKYELLMESVSDLTVFKHNNAHFLLDAIIRWVCYLCKERKKYFDELTKLIHFEEISEAYIEFLSKEYELNLSRPKTASGDESVLLKDDLQKYFNSNVDSNNNKSLSPYEKFVCDNLYSLNLYYLYDCNFDAEDGHSPFHVYTVDKFRPYGYLRNITRSNDCLNSRYLKIIASEEPNKYLYCLDDSSPLVFYRHTNTTLENGCKLTSPPFSSFGSYASWIDMCEMQSKIYLYSPSSKADNHCSKFTREELSRKIWCYDCKLDRWFPIPQFFSRTQLGSNIVTDGRLIYLIGFKDSSHMYTKGYVGMYDERTSKWQSLLFKTKVDGLSGDLACCCLDGKIYASNARTVSVLDTAAAKWETLSYNEQKHFPDGGRIEMASYQNKLWMMHYKMPCYHSLDLYTTIFDPCNKTWCNSDFLDKEINKIRDRTSNGSLEYHPSCTRSYRTPKLEIIVFKSQY